MDADRSIIIHIVFVHIAFVYNSPETSIFDRIVCFLLEMNLYCEFKYVIGWFPKDVYLELLWTSLCEANS